VTSTAELPACRCDVNSRESRGLTILASVLEKLPQSRDSDLLGYAYQSRKLLNYVVG
jgi:hypothetical protein